VVRGAESVRDLYFMIGRGDLLESKYGLVSSLCRDLSMIIELFSSYDF
jgi:hypothetical protein